jgi:hypothetical protein
MRYSYYLQDVKKTGLFCKYFNYNYVYGFKVSHALNVCQLPAAGRWFSPCSPVSSANKADRHDITEILLKVELNTINQTKPKMLIVPTLSFPVGPITFFMFSVPWYHVRCGV